MSMRKMMILAALLAALPAAAQAGSEEEDGDEDKGVAEEKLDKVIAAIPILRVPTTPKERRAQKDRGERVMLFKGRPGYVYRDNIEVPVRAGPTARVILSNVRLPNDGPDVYGCVTVSFSIRPDGKTDAFEVVKAEPGGKFEKHALQAMLATEYEPIAVDPAVAATPLPRRERSIWFLVARPQRAEVSRVNEAIEDSRNRRRAEEREACEGKVS